MNTINDKDFKRVMTVLFDVWTKAGEQATAQGLTGNEMTRAQEAVMTEFLAHIDEMRKAKQ